jgi:hypothetical protein
MGKPPYFADNIRPTQAIFLIPKVPYHVFYVNLRVDFFNQAFMLLF